jgi:hypothetical protein
LPLVAARSAELLAAAWQLVQLTAALRELPVQVEDVLRLAAQRSPCRRAQP